MVVSPQRALAKAEELYENRDLRARELKAQGKKVVGYLCCQVPLEPLTALGLVPYRITGDARQPVTRADAYLETIMCPFIRSCFDLALAGQYHFLDGLVLPHSCDTVERLYPIWNYYLKPSYAHFLNVPHMSYPSSRAFFRAELATFVQSLEAWTGVKLTEEGLRRAIQLHNENRALLRQAYDLRKQNPPLLSGAEALQLLVAGMVMPVEEHSQLLRAALKEVSPRRGTARDEKPRLLLYGAEMDDVAVLELIEECGGQVVVDDLCTGTRCFWQDVPQTPDPLEGLAQRYLEGIPCPRTYRPQKARERFRYLLDLARDYKVDGAILYVTRFCDTHEFDAPEIREYLEGEGLPVLHLEQDYEVSALGPLRTRLQAFLEMIGG